MGPGERSLLRVHTKSTPDTSQYPCSKLWEFPVSPDGGPWGEEREAAVKEPGAFCQPFPGCQFANIKVYGDKPGGRGAGGSHGRQLKRRVCADSSSVSALSTSGPVPEGACKEAQREPPDSLRAWR